MDWSQIFDMQLIGGLLFSLLTAFLVPLAGFGSKALIDWGKLQRQKLSAEQSKALDIAIKVGVLAAEQSMKEFDGEAKYAYVLAKAEKWLEEKGIVVDLDELSDRIEATVYEELKKWDISE